MSVHFLYLVTSPQFWLLWFHQHRTVYLLHAGKFNVPGRTSTALSCVNGRIILASFSPSSPNRLSWVCLGVLKNKLLFFLDSSWFFLLLDYFIVYSLPSGIFLKYVDFKKKNNTMFFLFPTLLISREVTSGKTHDFSCSSAGIQNFYYSKTFLYPLSCQWWEPPGFATF